MNQLNLFCICNITGVIVQGGAPVWALRCIDLDLGSSPRLVSRYYCYLLPMGCWNITNLSIHNMIANLTLPPVLISEVFSYLTS